MEGSSMQQGGEGGGGVGLFVNLAVAGLAPLLAAMVPKYLYRQGLSVRTNHIVLGVSAGLLFAIATLDLLPEAFLMTSSSSVHHHHPHLHHHHQQEQQEHAPDVPHELMRQLQRAPLQPPPTGRGLAGHERETPPSEEEEEGWTLHQASSRTAEDAKGLAKQEASQHETEEEEEGHPSRIAMIGVGVGYLVLLVVEQILTASGHSHSHGAPLQINDLDVRRELEETHAHSHNHRHGGDGNGALSESFSTVALVALALHCLVDGFIMAGAYEASAQIGARVAIALIMHKIPDGFVLSAVLSASRSNASFFSTVTLLAIMTPLGGLMGYVLMGGISKTLLSFVLGFGAGTFLFITATGIIPEIMGKETPKAIRNQALMAMVASYAAFLLVDTFFHAH